MHGFEHVLVVGEEELELELRFAPIAWAEFWLNPRRLRGSDFLMRWSQGVWSEQRLLEVVNQSPSYFAIPYGPSGVAPTGDVRAFELYFERLDAAGLGKLKRPDLLIFPKSFRETANKLIKSLGGLASLPFLPETETHMRDLLGKAIVAIECENSLWKAQQMPGYGSVLKPQKRLGGKLGLAKSAVLPTVIIKEEDRRPLLDWQRQNNLPIHVWHVFFDMAFGISLDRIEGLIADGAILPNEQTFQAPSGATTTKRIYKVYYQYAYLVGRASAEPALSADYIVDKNGHILPFVRFSGGKLDIEAAALEVLGKLVLEKG
jgi:hypothetical protein